MMSENFNLGSVFISYRQRYIGEVKKFAQYMASEGYISDIRWYEPFTLCADGELLTPREYFIIAALIWDNELSKVNTFVYLDRDFQDSFFTNVELAYWQIRSDVVYSFLEYNLYGPHHLPPWPQNYKDYFEYRLIKDNTLSDKDIIGKLIDKVGLTSKWHSYGENFYLIPCYKCGSNFLINKNKNLAAGVICPNQNCRNDSFRLISVEDFKFQFIEESDGNIKAITPGKRITTPKGSKLTSVNRPIQRKPIVLKQDYNSLEHNKPRTLSIPEMGELGILGNVPEDVYVIE
jgi:hypothetical protein